MTKDEFTRKLAKLNQIMNQLIFAFVQTGMDLQAGRRGIVQDANFGWRVQETVTIASFFN